MELFLYLLYLSGKKPTENLLKREAHSNLEGEWTIPMTVTLKADQFVSRLPSCATGRQPKSVRVKQDDLFPQEKPSVSFQYETATHFCQTVPLLRHPHSQSVFPIPSSSSSVVFQGCFQQSLPAFTTAKRKLNPKAD